MKKLVVFLMAVGFIVAGSGLAQADVLSWQTEPILGYSNSNVTGDVVVVTGPTPINPDTGLPYRDVDNNIVLGPTIPHYSIVGDSLNGVGSPSVSTFYYNPYVWDGAHWVDPLDPGVYTGSGINLDTAHLYTYKGEFINITGGGSLVTASCTDSGSGACGGPGDFVGSSFIMLMTGLHEFWPEDAGHWRYTETWTDQTTLSSITSSREFDLVQRVPEPATMLLLGLGLVGIAGIRRKFRN